MVHTNQLWTTLPVWCLNITKMYAGITNDLYLQMEDWINEKDAKFYSFHLRYLDRQTLAITLYGHFILKLGAEQVLPKWNI